MSKPYDQQTDLEKKRMTGPVHKVMQVRYKASQKNGQIIQGKIDGTHSFGDGNFIAEFDEKGHMVKDTNYNPGSIFGHVFDEQGRAIEIFNHYLKHDHKSTNKITYYDQHRQLESISYDGNGTVQYRVIHRYADDGKIIDRHHHQGMDGKVISKDLYTYDENRNLIREEHYDHSGKMNHWTDNTYNAAGKLIESKRDVIVTSSYDSFHHVTHEYNDYGDCCASTYYNRDGSIKDIYMHKLEYDAEGKRIIPKPKPVERPRLKPGETEQLEKDERGNWTRRILFFNEKPVNIYTREFLYFGEPERELIHPLTSEEVQSEAVVDKEAIEVMEPKDAAWVIDFPNAQAEIFSALRFYTVKYGEVPSVISYTGPYIEVMALMNELKEEMGAVEIHSSESIWNGGSRPNRYTLMFRRNEGYVLQTGSISALDPWDFDVPGFMRVDDYAYTGQLQLFRPSDASAKRDSEFEEDLQEAVEKFTLRKKPEKPRINMIEVNSQGFVMREHGVDDNFEIKDLDVNYGQGFSKFHSDLMQRFNSSTKGLVLFHGQPGTGKTFYIRHLLRKMVASKKVVIYMPPNMVDHMVDPTFLTFLTEEIKDWSADGKFCVLLIEDAEPLLARRTEGIRIQGITNLLNMTDGLLNDMLNLQIICTFNVDLKKLDSALLRPGRLIARKEFKALSVLDANLLASRLGIKHHFEEPATLGEIYAMRKNQNTLVHDVDVDKDSTDILDDLL